MKIRSILFLVVCLQMQCSFVKTGFASVKDSIHSDKQTKWTLFLPVWLPNALVNIESTGLPPVTNLPDEEPDEGDNIFGKLFNWTNNVDYFFSSGLMFQRNKLYTEFYMFGGKINKSVSFALTTGEILKSDVFAIVPDLRIGYIFFDKKLNKKLIERLYVSTYLGIRYNYIGIELGLFNKNDLLDISTGWIHALAGLKLNYHVTRTIELLVEADYGGRLSDKSRTYTVNPKLHVNIRKRLFIRGGYKFYTFNDKKDIDGEQYQIGLKMSGPTLSIGVQF